MRWKKNRKENIKENIIIFSLLVSLKNKEENKRKERGKVGENFIGVVSACQKWNEFGEAYKNNLLNLNPFFIFFPFIFFSSHFPLGYVWFPENLKENARERKYKGKAEEKKKWRKIKK